MNTLTLDKSDPEIAAALEGCEVGVPKTLTVTVVPTEDTDTIFTADVTDVEYTEDETETEEVEAPAKESYGKMPKAIVMIGMPAKKAA